MATSCLSAIGKILNRQNAKYFTADFTENVKKETMSASMRNMDAKEITGMISAAQKSAPNATLCYWSSQMEARKNKTVAYVDNLSEER